MENNKQAPIRSECASELATHTPWFSEEIDMNPAVLAIPEIAEEIYSQAKQSITSMPPSTRKPILPADTIIGLAELLRPLRPFPTGGTTVRLKVIGLKRPSTIWWLVRVSMSTEPHVSRILLLLASLVIIPGFAATEPDQIQIKDVAFTATCDGTEQRYVRMLPGGFQPGQPCDLLIALHGHGSDRWQFVRDPRAECCALRDAATAYRMIYVSPDYRARTSWMGPKAEADVVQIIAELKRQHRIRRVFLCGASMGGTASLTFAALHPALVDGVVAMNATGNLLEFANFQDAMAASFGGSKSDVPHEYAKRSAELRMEHLTMPVGLTVGGKDLTVPPQSVMRLAAALEAAGRPVLLVRRDSTGHVTSYDDARTILEFVIHRVGGNRDGLAKRIL